MISRYLATAAALVGLAAAQTSSECNPLNQTNCDPNPAFGTEAYWHFNQTPSLDLWRTTVGSVPYDADKGATFTINKQGDSPTIRTNFYFFFGRTELHLKAASGVGIVSSMMWLSDDLDEVDWELLGYNNTHATTNYFGKGREDFSVAQQHYMKDGMQDDYHNYTTTWTSSQLQWYIDGELVRTLKPAEANSTDNYPQTPMRLSIGIWAGGDPDLPDGTREWAGGTTNYDDGPFTMYVKSATVEDYSSGKEYAYSDQSGHWKSIKITAGNSTAYEALHTEPEKTTGEKWESLPVATKTAVYAGGAGAGAAAIAALAFFMMRARRAGGAEAAQAEKAESERVELMRFKNGEDTANQGHEYSSGGWTRL
ncbi:concanavalin A-like lectin/glucanase domain-containing protein [Dactylonectria estremocensis]|uniref:chitinase n=1 Tax=Dactylonectria estremocensis TaxID=1079267 RepID=A0A9P9DVB8_9HYPO|nr:concanavalin A-like lectin/glucanase domain-containing protein [Dactylonectria estremocensis]